MKDRRKRDGRPWSRFFYFTVCVVFSCIFFSGFTFSSLRLFQESFHPVLSSTWGNSVIMEAKSDDDSAISSSSSPTIEIRETVVFPDQVLLFLKYPPSTPLFTKHDLDCFYFPQNSSQSQLKLPPISTDRRNPDHQIVRCPINPRGLTTSLSLKSYGVLDVRPSYRWDSLVYEALVDRDNTTIVFVKGLNLRPGRISDASRLECVYGWDFTRPKLFLSSRAISAAQEIVRCETPLSVLSSPHNKSIKVSIRVKGRGGGVLNSIARPQHRLQADQQSGKQHEMCVCTMVRNQARFLSEWVMYHARIGVQRWFIYDNNSDDDIDELIESLDGSGYNISRYVWPWIKTQESGFAHCALQAREMCEWVGFIDVDEFLHVLPAHLSFYDVLHNQTDQIGEIRTFCHSFGPSGLKRVPEQGVIVGYTCRMVTHERHKSIVRTEALDSSLINVVHHFHLMDGFESVTLDRALMVINHYKYQVWDVFKEKFYRRVATYVADWQNEENVGSRDRAPGLGTRAIEPPNWSTRFCEVTDMGLRDRVLKDFADPRTRSLPWQEDRLLIEGK